MDFERVFFAFLSEALRTSQKVSFLKRCLCREFNSNASDENAKNYESRGCDLSDFLAGSPFATKSRKLLLQNS